VLRDAEALKRGTVTAGIGGAGIIIRFCCCCCNICSIMSLRRVLVVVIETAAGGAEIVGARAVISRAAGIVVDVSD